MHQEPTRDPPGIQGGSTGDPGGVSGSAERHMQASARGTSGRSFSYLISSDDMVIVCIIDYV